MNVTLVGIAAMIGAGHFFYKGYSAMQSKKLIETTPTTDIRKLSEGFAEVQGKAVLKDKLLKAPFSGKECIGYKCEVDVQKSDIDDDHHVEEYWVTKNKEVKVSSFYMKDESGEALINPEGATLDFSSKYSVSSGRKVEPPEHIVKYLNEKSIGYKGLLGYKIMRFNVYRIDKDDKLYIAGFASKINDKNVKFSIGKQKFLTISDTDEKSILTRFNREMITSFIGTGVLVIIGLMFFMLGMSGYKI
jgi:hypothetical protein